MKLIIIHSYNGDTADSFARDIEETCRKKGIQYRFPLFPTRARASYESWKTVMDQEKIDENTILIAHSLGTQFVPKYLSETKQRINTYVSVAGYLHYEGRSDLEEINRNFEPSDQDFANCRKQIHRRISLYSDNDRMNQIEKLEAYAEALDAEKILVPGAGHFDPASGIRKLPVPDDFIDVKKLHQ